MNRRAFIAGVVASASIAAVATPEGASTYPASCSFKGEVPRQLDRSRARKSISELWIERHEMDAEYRKARRLRRRLERRLMEQMPKPDPSIVFSPANEADGLKHYSDIRPPHSLNAYIYPQAIEAALQESKPSGVEGTEPAGTASVVRPEPLALSPDQLALQRRLAARLELSRAYKRRIKRVSDEIGLSAVEKRIDRLLSVRARLDDHIVALPAKRRSEFAAKVAIFREYSGDGHVSDRIVADLRRLIDAPDEWARAWGSDSEATVAKA